MLSLHYLWYVIVNAGFMGVLKNIVVFISIMLLGRLVALFFVIMLNPQSSLLIAVLGLTGRSNKLVFVCFVTQKGAGDFIGGMKFCPTDVSKIFVASGDGTGQLAEF